MTANLSPELASVPLVEAGDLSFESTVPRAMVHRHAVSEVFLTDSARLSDTEFLVAAHLPTAHGFFGDLVRRGRADPMFFVEVSRQACVLLAHRYFGVPRGYGFVFRESTMTVLDAEALRLGSEPVRVVLTVEVPQVRYRHDMAELMELSVSAAVDGRAAIRFTGAQLMLPRETFTQLRAAGMAGAAREPGRQDGPPLDARLVGRTDPRNVVLSPASPPHGAEGMWELIVDQSHPVFFDHAQDHVPGLLLVEAIRQAAVAAVGGPVDLESITLSFDRFVELGVTAYARATVDGSTVAVELLQGGQSMASASVRVA